MGLKNFLKRRKVRKFSAAEQQRVREAGLVVLSFPKSGRTWHRLMLGCYLSKLADVRPEEAIDPSRLSLTLGAGSIAYTHNGANFTDGVLPSDARVADPTVWSGRRVLLIVRDPRDVLVSAYHHARYRDCIFERPIEEFIRAPTTGIDKVLTALNRWHQGSDLAEKFKVISYEQMHRNPVDALRSTLSLIELPIEERALLESVEFAKFANMKAYEELGIFADGRMRNVTGTAQGAKVRAGRVGGFTEHLSESDIDYIAKRTSVIGDPFAQFYM